MAKYRNEYENNWTAEYCLLTLKALADENRLRALIALRARELCQCQVVELLELAPSTVSKHLSLLKQVGLIESRKVGRWIYFRAVAGEDTKTSNDSFQNQLAELITAHTKNTELIRSDRRRIKEILCIDPECLCESQRASR